jgi:hypothetical protein
MRKCSHLEWNDRLTLLAKTRILRPPITCRHHKGTGRLLNLWFVINPLSFLGRNFYLHYGIISYFPQFKQSRGHCGRRGGWRRHRPSRGCRAAGPEQLSRRNGGSRLRIVSDLYYTRGTLLVSKILDVRNLQATGKYHQSWLRKALLSSWDRGSFQPCGSNG